MNTLEHLTVKFINQEATLLDLEELYALVKIPANEALFKDFIRVNYYSIYLMNEIENQDIIKALEQKIRADKNKQRVRRFVFTGLKYAAVAAVFLGVGYYFNFRATGVNSEEQVLPVKDQIILKTSSGESYVLDAEDPATLKQKLQVTAGANEIDYKNAGAQKNQHHTLSVPYGKRYNIALSDGTRVFLNSGSSLTYPVAFQSNEMRKVTLEGEAYFEVTPSQDLFEVESSGLSVEVYGTAFNFKNYQEDSYSDVVLVHGSVGINTGEERPVVKITPGIKGSVFKDDKSVSTERVNTKLYTSWIDGEIVIRKETFDQIVTKLERLYNVSIINNKTADSQLFNANISPDTETIEEVLMYFKEIYKIEYQIYENKIIIN